MVSTANTEAAGGLRKRLGEIGFTPAGIREALDGSEETTFPRGDVAMQSRRLVSGTPLSTAIRLFVLGLEVGLEAARSALAPVAVEALEELGVVEHSGNECRAPVQLLPSDTLLLASDRPDTLESPEARRDYVGPVNPTSVTLAKLTVRRPVASALDLGTGCGIQALLLASFAERVVATDVNPRALEFVAFNALLNGIENIETRQGTFFGPVEDERFDLVVSNPPFVISPDTRFVFRDSGLAADQVCGEVVAGAAGALAEGGFATVLVNWVGRKGEEEPLAPPGRWFENRGCDGWVLHSGGEDPLRYASIWNQLLRRTDAAGYAAALDRWGAYHAALEAESIHYGAVVLRRRTGAANWTLVHELPAGALQPAGDHILRVFSARDERDAVSDEAFLDRRLRLVERHRLEQVARLTEGEYRIEKALLCLEEGIPFEGAVDTYTLHLLARCDGRRTLREALADVAETAGLDSVNFTRTGAPIVRRLYELGFLDAP